MGVQTSYGNQALGFAGQREGMGHFAATYANDLGAVRQVDDVTVDAAVAATPYQFEVDGVAIAIVSPAGTPTVGEIRDLLLTQARSIAELEQVCAFQPNGADTIRITAVNPGAGFATTNTDANMTLVNTIANVAPEVVPFGRAVVRRTTGANLTDSSARNPSVTGQTFLGVAERIHSGVNPSTAGTGAGFPDAGYAAGQAMSVGRRGRWIVQTDEAVNADDPAFFRHTGAAADIGKFRTDVATGNADAVPTGVFLTSTTGAGLAVLGINLV